LGAESLYYIWMAAGAMGLVAWALFAHRAIRRIAGHRKFRGTWYSPAAWEGLLNILDEDQRSGNRVMRFDEIKLLREWRQGSEQGIGFDGRNSYFP